MFDLADLSILNATACTLGLIGVFEIEATRFFDLIDAFEIESTSRLIDWNDALKLQPPCSSLDSTTIGMAFVDSRLQREYSSIGG